MQILITLFVLLATITAHGLLARLPLLKKANSVKLFMLIGSLSGLLYALNLYQKNGIALDLFSNLLIYAFGCELYIFIFTMTISSISANLLMRLLKRNISVTEVESYYDSKHMVDSRIDRLVAIGLIVASQQELSLSEKGKRLAKSFAWFRLFFRHPV